jgi:hypothetical protein
MRTRILDLPGEGSLELHITSPVTVPGTAYRLTGAVRGVDSQSKIENQESKIDLRGFSIRIESPATGLVDEAFLDERGTFSQELELAANDDTVFHLTVYDAAERALARTPFRVTHQPPGSWRGPELADAQPGQPETACALALEPPWTRFAKLVKHCLFQAGSVADRTGRARDELFEQVYSQERYAERAYAEKNQALYRECYENLGKLAGYLDQLLYDALQKGVRNPFGLDS